MYDPWQPLGVQQSPNAGAIVTLQYAFGAHHLDLRGSDPADPASVVQIRALEANILTKWMRQARLLRASQ
jgi:hypothetical protein